MFRAGCRRTELCSPGRFRLKSLAGIAVLLFAQPATVAIAQTSWEYSPYKVRLFLKVAPSVPLPVSEDDRFRERLLRQAEVKMGAAWQLDMTDPPAALKSLLGVDIGLVTVEMIEKAQPSVLLDDKLMMLSIEASPLDYVIRARELDCRTRILGPLVTRRTRQLGRLSDEALIALLDAFAALARIEAGEGKTLTVRVRAGGLVSDPESPAYFANQDILQPVVRLNDRLGKPQRISAVEWTFLRVVKRDEFNPNLLEVHVHSGWRNPIRGRVGSRREQYALAVRPTLPSTELRLVTKTDEPLPGMEVYARRPTNSSESRDEPRNPSEFLGYTNWRGAIRIGHGSQPLRIIYVKNGGQLLARLPIVTGLTESLLARLPDDNPRLQAEGAVKGFNGELMDLVARRQILAVRVRKRIADGELKEARALFQEFDKLPTRSDMQRRLDAYRNRQQEARNPAVQARIDLLFAETRRALGKFLDPALRSRLAAELQSAAKRVES